MKELKSNEIQLVSGAGLNQFLAGLNNALSHVNTELSDTAAALEASDSTGKSIGLAHKQFGLSMASGHMTGLYNFLSSLTKTA